MIGLNGKNTMDQVNFLKQMLASGVNNLHNNYPHIDKTVI
jgi:hypothetical protein